MNYQAQLTWTGSDGRGTTGYAEYGRSYRVQIAGKPELEGSADPSFRGDASRHNPEDLFLIAVSACHMLTYLALCARSGIRVVEYTDDATGTLEHAGGTGQFREVVLSPSVTLAAGDPGRAAALHEEAHARCFIARSCNFPILHRATVRFAEGGR